MLLVQLQEDFKIAGLTTSDVYRLFRSMDTNCSGTVSCSEFVEAIEQTPPAILVDKVGRRTVPSSLVLKKREAFNVWPCALELGIFRRSEKRLVEFTVQNVGSMQVPSRP